MDRTGLATTVGTSSTRLDICSSSMLLRAACAIGLVLLVALPCRAAPVIDSQPSDVVACEGEAASFTVTAHSNNAGTLTFQWRRGTTNLVNGGNIFGATAPTLIISPVQLADAALNYNVVISQTGDGSLTSHNASLTVNPAPAVPTNVAATPSSLCGPGSSTLSANVGAGATVDWYSGACEGVFEGTGTSILVTVSSTTTYFAQARNTTTDCVSQNCVSVTVTVHPIPDCTITAASPVPPNSTGNTASVPDAGPGTTYAWSIPPAEGAITSGQGTRNIVYNAGNGPSVTLSVTITTVFNCTCSNSVVVSVGSGPATISMAFDKNCYKPGDTVTATLSMSGLGTPAAGFQAFLSYNTSNLTFVTWQYTPTPFGLPVLNTLATVNPAPGNLDLASGIDQPGGQSPSQANALLVTLTFTVPLNAANNCTATGLLTFRAHTPPTRITDAFGNELQPLTTINAPTVTIDGTAPVIIPGTINSCYPTQAAAETAALTATVAHDNCTPDNQIVELASTVGTCSAVITVTEKDCAGNLSSIQYNTIIDNDVPLISCPAAVTVQCTSDVPANATNLASFVSQGGSASDVCSVSVSFVNDVINPLGCTNHYAITRTYRAADPCGHTADCTQTITVNDTTAPVIGAVTNNGPLLENGACTVTAHWSGSVTDNCCILPANVSLAVTLPSGNATLGAPTIVKTQNGANRVDYTVDVTVSNLTSCPAVARLTVNGSDCCSIPASNGPVVSNVSVSDNTAPLIGVVTNNSPQTENAACTATAHWSGSVTDNCCITPASVSLTVTLPTGNATLGVPTIVKTQNGQNRVDYTVDVTVSSVTGCPAVAQLSVDALDCCFNPASNGPLTSNVTVSDTTAPVVGVVTNNSPQVVNASCTAIAHWSGSVTDNCCITPAAVSLVITLPTANATLGAPTIVKTQNGQNRVDYTVDVSVSNLTSCPATARLTINGIDCCSNPATQVISNVSVSDTTPPVITCPANMTVNADAGGCTAAVNPGIATATDNCTPNPTIVGVRSDNGGNSVTTPALFAAPYPTGTTTITWTATDACANPSSCLQTVTVNAINIMIASLELSPTINTGGSFPQTITRCITFQLWNCPAVSPAATVNQTITFTRPNAGSPSRATNVSVSVPCGAYTCVTARDKLHTLRRTLAAADGFGIVALQYQADFVTPGKQLIGGNLNDDAFIDILDFGVFTSQFNKHYDGLGHTSNSSFAPDSGNTDCTTPFPHADISGDGVVFTSDFTFIQINFLTFRDPNCCGAANIVTGGGQGEEDGPVTSISVRELGARHLEELAVADLNHDGVLDQQDIVAWMQGVRPSAPPSEVPPKQIGPSAPTRSGVGTPGSRH